MKHLLLTVGVLALTASPLWAQARGVGPWHPVKDEIGFFSQGAKDRADEQIAALKKAYNKDLVIEALKAPKRPDGLDVKDKAAVNKFFDEFAEQRFKKLNVNGVYVMILDNPHILRVDVGNNTRIDGYFTAANRDTLIEKLREKLSDKSEGHDAALAAATSYVVDTMKANHPVVNRKGGAVAPVAAPAEHAVQHAAPASAGFRWAPILTILAIVVVVWVVFAVIRGLMAGAGGGYGPGMGYGGGGGGFMSNFLGGLVGAAAGMWMYNTFFGGHGSQAWGAGTNDMGGSSSYPDSGPADTSGSVGGADYGDDAGGKGGDWGGGDAGGGADAGGGDWGGGGGGDWGGGGGGDWGGGGGGGDW